MKNLLVLLFILLVYPIQNICSQIKTGASLELGYEDRIILLDNGFGNSSSSTWLRKKEFADILLNAYYKNFSIYTSVKTSFKTETITKYDPFQVGYKIGLNYTIERFSLNIEHFCSHSIRNVHTLTNEYFYDASDKVSIKIDFGSNKK